MSEVTNYVYFTEPAQFFSTSHLWFTHTPLTLFEQHLGNFQVIVLVKLLLPTVIRIDA